MSDDQINGLIQEVLGHLAGLEERTKAIQETVVQLRSEFKRDIDELKEWDKNFHKEVDDGYTKKVEFEPVKKAVYGIISFLLLSIGGMFISLLGKNLGH